MRRGSGSLEAQRPGEFGVGKRIPNPGGGLLNKRRERQSCAINFVLSLSLSLYLQLGPSTFRKLVLDCLKHKLLGHFIMVQVCWISGVATRSCCNYAKTQGACWIFMCSINQEPFFFQMRFRLSISISEKRSKCQYGVCQYFFNSVGIFIYKINLFLQYVSVNNNNRCSLFRKKN